MFVFKKGDNIKICLFETKWPRVKNDPSYNWDYIEKKSKISHFSSQVERQSNWTKDVAIWEMFFYEEAVSLYSNSEDLQSVPAFMEEVGLSFFQQVDVVTLAQ